MFELPNSNNACNSFTSITKKVATIYQAPSSLYGMFVHSFNNSSNLLCVLFSPFSRCIKKSWTHRDRFSCQLADDSELCSAGPLDPREKEIASL